MTATVAVTERAEFVLAHNPNIMTLDGTNTWILREPGASRSVVVDPGPADDGHLGRVIAAAGDIALVLFTHRHLDHTASLDRFVELTGAPSRASDPAFCRGAGSLVDGERIDVDGLAIDVVATPGHTTDSTSFLLPDDRSLLTGDHVLGRGTTVIAHPDGALGPYLDSLARVRGLIEQGEVDRLLPGHGPVVEHPRAHIDFYVEHRHQRLSQVRSAVRHGASTPREVVEVVYADVDPVLWDAAELSVAAQLDHLRATPPQ